jgi:hypothetical protein
LKLLVMAQAPKLIFSTANTPSTAMTTAKNVLAIRATHLPPMAMDVVLDDHPHAELHVPGHGRQRQDEADRDQRMAHPCHHRGMVGPDQRHHQDDHEHDSGTSATEVSR